MTATEESVEASNTGDDTSSDTDPGATWDDDIIGTMMERMSAHVAAENGDAPAEGDTEQAAEEKPAEEPAPEPAKADAKPDPEPEPEKPEPKDRRLELRYGKAIEDLKEATTKLVAHKQELTTTKTELARLAKLGKDNPLALAEELSGLKFHELMDKAAKGEFDKPVHADVSPEIKAQLDRLSAFEKAETERRDAEKKASDQKATDDKAAADRVADRAHVSTILQGKADELPFCASLDFVADRIVDEAYAELKAGRKPDPVAIAKQMEAEAKDFIRGLVTNTQVMALLAGDKEVRDSISKAFGGLSEQKKSPVSDPRTAVPKPARTLPNSHEIPARVDSGGFASPDEERAESVRLLRRLIDGQSI